MKKFKTVNLNELARLSDIGYDRLYSVFRYERPTILTDKEREKLRGIIAGENYRLMEFLKSK